jgi:folate-binding Fe-S cluster repair protein YgfZ
LDEWAVDFHKGCYLGQEVISRIESVGRVKRKLSLISAEVPFQQNSAMRNSSGTEVRPTRESKENSEGDFLSLALFPAPEKAGYPHDVQRVVKS